MRKNLHEITQPDLDCEGIGPSNVRIYSFNLLKSCMALLTCGENRFDVSEIKTTELNFACYWPEAFGNLIKHSIKILAF